MHLTQSERERGRQIEKGEKERERQRVCVCVRERDRERGDRRMRWEGLKVTEDVTEAHKHFFGLAVLCISVAAKFSFDISENVSRERCLMRELVF